jgi:hypothetical protein
LTILEVYLDEHVPIELAVDFEALRLIRTGGVFLLDEAAQQECEDGDRQKRNQGEEEHDGKIYRVKCCSKELKQQQHIPKSTLMYYVSVICIHDHRPVFARRSRLAEATGRPALPRGRGVADAVGRQRHSPTTGSEDAEDSDTFFLLFVTFFYATAVQIYINHLKNVTAK